MGEPRGHLTCGLLGAATLAALVGAGACGAPEPPSETPQRPAASAPVSSSAPAPAAPSVDEPGPAPAAGCDGPPVPTGCEPVAVTGLQASDVAQPSDEHGAARASDGDSCTVWNAGRLPPAWIELSLAPGAHVSGLVMLPEMTPDGAVSHVLETPSQDADAPMHPFAVVERDMQRARPFVAVFPTPIEAQRLRVRTVRSPSWVAWRELVPFTCNTHPDATTSAPPPPVPDTPPPPAGPATTLNFGRGACRTDTDCAPVRCCHAPTCVAREDAPRCAGVGCPQNVGPMSCPDCGCVCIHGRCGARVREAAPVPGDPARSP